MAELAELPTIFANTALKNRLQAAVCVKAQALLETAPTADQRTWALATLGGGTAAEADWVLKFLIAKNRALTVAQIVGVLDADLVTLVGAAVDTVYPPAA